MKNCRHEFGTQEILYTATGLSVCIGRRCTKCGQVYEVVPITSQDTGRYTELEGFKGIRPAEYADEH